MHLKTELQQLEETLLAATDFREPWRLFYDRVLASERLGSTGSVRRNKPLEQIVTLACQRVLGAGALLGAPRLVHLREAGFWHGMAELRGGAKLGVFYFERSDAGLLGTMLTPRLELVRFAVVRLPQPGRAA